MGICGSQYAAIGRQSMLLFAFTIIYKTYIRPLGLTLRPFSGNEVRNCSVDGAGSEFTCKYPSLQRNSSTAPIATTCKNPRVLPTPCPLPRRKHAQPTLALSVLHVAVTRQSPETNTWECKLRGGGGGRYNALCLFRKLFSCFYSQLLNFLTWNRQWTFERNVLPEKSKMEIGSKAKCISIYVLYHTHGHCATAYMCTGP